MREDAMVRDIRPLTPLETGLGQTLLARLRDAERRVQEYQQCVALAETARDNAAAGLQALVATMHGAADEGLMADFERGVLTETTAGTGEDE